MSVRTELASKYVEAQRTREPAAIDAVADALADNAELVSQRGNLSGKAAIIDRLKNPPQGMGGGGGGGMFGQIQWGEPEETADTVKVSATLPPNPMLQGLTLTFTFSGDDKIQKIETVAQR